MVKLTIQMKDLETWQVIVMGTLQPKAANDLQHQRREQQDKDTRGLLIPSLSQNYDHKELTNTILSLAHTLVSLSQEVNRLKPRVTESDPHSKLCRLASEGTGQTQRLWQNGVTG